MAHKVDFKEIVQVHGKGLFTRSEVTVSISKAPLSTGIVFVLNNEKIPAKVENVTNTSRNTVLSNGKESICLVEHFLAACSLCGISDLEVLTNTNELVFNDGSANHYYEVLLKNELCFKVSEKYELSKTLFVKNNDKEIIAIPHDGFKVSYFMDYPHPALGKLFASWEDIIVEGEPCRARLLRARTFGTKEENDFFGVSDRLLTLDESGFNKQLHEPLEPVYHKILDIIGDLRLCGVNPLEINMHVIGFKSGHALNVEMAKELTRSVILSVSEGPHYVIRSLPSVRDDTNVSDCFGRGVYPERSVGAPSQ